MARLPKVLFVCSLILLFMVIAPKPVTYASEPAGWGKATVSWQQASGAVKYRIYYRESGEKSFTHAAQGIPPEAREYTINYLKSGVSYHYQVVAVSGDGSEFWKSSLGSFWSGGNARVWIPANAQAAARGMTRQTSMSVSSTAGKNWATASWPWQPRAEYYNVYYRESGEKTFTHAVPHVPANGTSVTIAALKPGVGYYYNVAAYYDGMEHWLGQKTLVWPVEVVYIKDSSYGAAPTYSPTPMMRPQGSPSTYAPSTGTSDPFANTIIPTLPPPVTSPEAFY